MCRYSTQLLGQQVDQRISLKDNWQVVGIEDKTQKQTCKKKLQLYVYIEDPLRRL